MLGISLKNVLDEFQDIVNLFSFPLPRSPRQTLPFHRWVICSPFRQNNSRNFPFSRYISVYLFLYSEPKLSKSRELNNQGMKENSAFRNHFFLSHEKNKIKVDRLCMKFSWNPKTSLQRRLNCPFQRPLFLLPSYLFQGYLNPRLGSTKWWTYMVLILLPILCNQDKLILNLHQKNIYTLMKVDFYRQIQSWKFTRNDK